MPELPEVETTRRGIQPYVLNRPIKQVLVRDRRLRWPVPEHLNITLRGQMVSSLRRRSKYILLGTDVGTLIIHLGMSGSLRVLQEPEEPARHDHIDIVMKTGDVVRYRDPRRFGCFLWTAEDPFLHKLLVKLGPEPLSNEFTAEGLYNLSRNRKVAIKNFIMDASVVVGVGNIYASESLARAGIHPLRSAARVSLKRYVELVRQIRFTLKRSIKLGGTTLRDFVMPDGNPGYFEQTLVVYGRAGEPCRHCGSAIRQLVIGQRSSFYCPKCQR
jgi:formamidopyrimidine-DNA glycosylase